MKVLVAHNRYSSAQPSGENTVVDAEMRMLAEAGVAVVPFLRSSDEIPALPPAQRALLPVSPIYAPHAQRDLAALLAAERPDVVHLHNPYPLLSPWVVRTAHAHGVPVVQTVHNFRHVCVSGVFYRQGRECQECVGRAWAVPAVRHGCYRGSRAQSVVMATALAAHRGTWRRVDRFLALNPTLGRHLSTLGVPDDRVVVRPNVAPDPGPHTVPGDGFLFVGRLSPEKGVGLLLDAWSRHPDGSLGRLSIAGDGPLRGAVEAAASARGDVAYLGRLAAAQVSGVMRRAAVVVVPSTCPEVCPMALIEALANGRPVLATANGGLPWLIGADQPGEAAGWVVVPAPDALAAALPRARAEAGALVEVARRRYEQWFSPTAGLAALLAVYRDVAAPAAARR